MSGISELKIAGIMLSLVSDSDIVYIPKTEVVLRGGDPAYTVRAFNLVSQRIGLSVMAHYSYGSRKLIFSKLKELYPQYTSAIENIESGYLSSPGVKNG